MNTKKSVEEKIQQSFDDFFSSPDNLPLQLYKTRSPSDFKRYRKSIYNTLCSSYKNEENKIDRDYILKHFVAPENRKKFVRTNIYSRKGIIDAFERFFEDQKNKGKNTRTVGDLEERNASLLITIARKYGYTGNQKVGREQFIKDYNLDRFGCHFCRDVPVRTPITKVLIKKEVVKILENKKTISPSLLPLKHLKWLGKHFRDVYGKIDRLKILYQVFEDPEIIERFNHRYAYDRMIKVRDKVIGNKQIDESFGIIGKGTLNPEEILIQKEDNENKQTLLQVVCVKIYNILSQKEMEKLFGFLEGDDCVESEMDIELQDIIQKLM